MLDLVLTVDLGAKELAPIRLKDAEEEREDRGLADAVRRMDDVMQS